jgi:hypothetical protein
MGESQNYNWSKIPFVLPSPKGDKRNFKLVFVQTGDTAKLFEV